MGTSIFNSNAQIIVTNFETNGNTGVSEAGDNLDYTIILLNNGSQDLTGISTSYILPDASSATLVGPVESISANGICDLPLTSSTTVTVNALPSGPQ